MSGSAKRWTDGKTETRWNDRDDAMTDTETTVFREKTLKKASDPEQLDGYLKVTGFGPWFVILAAALVLAAIFVWAFFGRVQTVISGAGYCKNGMICCSADYGSFLRRHSQHSFSYFAVRTASRMTVLTSFF